MKINDDVIASIDENLVDVSSGWLWSTADVYSPDYTSILEQPVSVESSTLNELRYLSSATDIVIRETYNNKSLILWAGYVDLIEDPQQIVPNHNDLLNLQGGSSTLSEYYHLSATTYGYVNSLSANAQNQLRNVSATKVDKSIIISAGTGLTGGGSLSANVTISMPTVGTSGTYTKVTTDAYGRVTSGTTLTSADIPQLPATKIGSGNISNTEFEYLDGVSANIQNQLTNLSGTASQLSSSLTSATYWNSTYTTVNSNSADWETAATNSHTHSNKSNLDLINQNLNTSASPTFAALTVGSISNTELQYLDGISANAQTQLSVLSATKADKSIIISAGTGLTGGGSLSANRTISLATTGTQGTYTKVVTDAYGRVTSGTTLLPSDLPNGIDASKINSGVVSNTEFEYLSGTSANIQTQFNNLSATNHIHTNKAFLDNINQNLSTSASVSFLAISASTINVGNVSNTEFQYLNTVSANIQTQLTNLSATKADKTTTITAGTGLTGGGNLTTNRTISLATTGTAGTYDKVVTNAYGQVTSGRNLISSDLPSGIDASKIADGSVSNTEFQYLNTVSANIQTQLNNKASTVGLTAYQLRSEKGTSLGYAALDTNSKIYTSSIPDAILGQLKYGGSWNANTNIPTLSSAPSMSGTFFIVNVSGTTRPIGLNPNTSASLWPDGNVEWKVGDWIVSDGTYYDKVDNTDAIYSWNGRLGAIVPAAGDYTATQITNTASGNITATTVQAAINELDTEKVPKTTTITAGTGLTGGGDLTTNRTISLATTGTAGTYTKVTTDAYGRVTAGTQQTSADIPQIPATKIGSGNINNTEFEYLNGLSANAQTQLTNLSALDSQKALKTTTITAGTGLTGGGNLTTNRTIALATTGTAGTYDKVVTNAYGQVTSGRLMISADIPQLPATKIGSGNISNTEFEYLDGVSANIQNQLNGKWTLLDSRITDDVNNAGNYNRITDIQSSALNNPGASTSFLLNIRNNAASTTYAGQLAITSSPTSPKLAIRNLSNGNWTSWKYAMFESDNPDLVAIEALTGTSGFLKKTAANTWTLDSSSYLTAPNVKEIYNWYSSRPTDCDLAPNGNGGIRSFKATNSMVANKPPQGDSHIIHIGWDNVVGFDSQISVYPKTGALQVRGQEVGVWSSWRTIWDSVNLTNLNQLTNGPGYMASSSYPDLVAIEALAGTSGLLRKTAANTWILDASSYLTTTGKAADSELLDGIDSSRFVYGGNGTATTNKNGTLFGDLVKSGFYDSSTSTDSPVPSSWTHLIHGAHTNNPGSWGFQLAANFGAGNSEGYFLRTKINNAWTSWKTIYHSGNLTNLNQLTNGPGYLTAPNVKEIYNWYSSRPTDCDLAPNGNGGIRSFKATSSMTANKPPQGDSHILHLGWDNTWGWDSQISVLARTGQLQVRGQDNGTWGAWRTVWDAANLPVNAAHLSGTSANIQTQLTNLSATKADKTITITAGTGLTGGGNLTTNRTISLATTGTAGTYGLVVTNAYGQVTSGRAMTSGDIPQIPATKIGSGNINNTEFEYLNGVTSNIQTQLNGKQNVAIVYDTGTTSPSWVRIASISATSDWASYSSCFRASNRRGTYELFLKLATAVSVAPTEEQAVSIGAGDDKPWRIKRTTGTGTVTWDVYFYNREYASVISVQQTTEYVSAMTETYPGNYVTTDPGSDIIPKEVSNFSIDNWDTAYANTHTHSNKSYLDTINQSLATTASPTFDALTVGTLTTGPNKLSILGQYYAYTEYLTQFNGVNAGIDYSTNSFSFAHTDAVGNYIDTPLRISLDVGGELETTLPVVAPSHRFGTLTIPSYPYTLARGSYYYVWPKIQASGASGTIYLPASPQAGDSFMIFATNGASGKNTVGIMSVSGNGKTIILTNNNTSSQDYGTANAVYMYVNTMFTYDGTYWYAFKGING